MDDLTNRYLIVIKSRIDELERYPTNNEQLARIDELKIILEILLAIPPPPLSAMVDFSDIEVIRLIKSRIEELKVFPIYSEQVVIKEVDNLLVILHHLNKEDVDMENLNSSFTRAAIVRINRRIDELKEGPTNKRVISEFSCLRRSFVRLLEGQVHDDFSEVRLVKAIVDLLSFASPKHSSFDPDWVDNPDNIPYCDPMLLLDENDLETIHQFVSRPYVYTNMLIRDAISEFCINANLWLLCNSDDADADTAVHRVRLKKIISAINNLTLEMESEKLSADNGQQSNSRDGKRLKSLMNNRKRTLF